MDDLEELLQFSQKILTTLKIDLRRIHNRKFLLLSMMGASQHFCESILILLKDKKVVASQALTRTVLENWLNAQYIFIGGRNRETLLRFVADDELGLVKSLNSMIELATANPSLNTGILNQEKLGELFRVASNRVDKIKKSHHSVRKPMPSIRMRAKAIDKYNRTKLKSDPKHLLEWHYLVVYKYFCNDVHLGTRGLGRFLENRVGGSINFAINGTDTDVAFLVPSVFVLHLGVLDLFSQQFKIPTREEIKPFIMIAKELGKR